jgi:hypothetical protein
MRLRKLLLPTVVALLALLPALPLQAADDFSPAERALFMNPQLGGVKPPLTLHFGYRKLGTLEAGFDDDVTVKLSATTDGACCSASAEFLHGERALKLPDVESGQGNPAILYFLERDIREMQRLTKGQANYFRKRIRMAVYQGATLRPVQVAWAGQPVDAQEIVIRPYLDDPLRERFEQLAGKEYLFILSNAVPGGVLSMRSRVAGSAPGAAPLLAEEMTLQSAEATPGAPAKAKVAGTARPGAKATP